MALFEVTDYDRKVYEEELKDSFQFEDENGNVIEDEEEFDAFDDGADEF